MPLKNSYNFDAFADRQQEAALLDIRAKRGATESVHALKELGLRENMRVLDVGAGTGTRAIALAKYLKHGEVVGIDSSTALLKLAEGLRIKAKVKNAFFQEANVLSKKEMTTLGQFDFIHMRLVVQHLHNPVRALQNLRQILRPKGKLFIEDTDRDWMTVVPPTPGWEEIYERMKRGQAERGGDPNSGRKLGHYLDRAGFGEVGIKLVPVWGSSDKVLDWLQNYAPTYLNFLETEEARKAKRIMTKIEKQCLKTPTYFMQVWFQAVGRKT